MTKTTVSGKTLHNLFREIYHLHRNLAAVADETHEKSGLGSPQRQVLAFLQEQGPATVPHIGRFYGFSRQHIQVNVNALLEKGFVQLIPNPHHVISALVDLTAAGKAALDEARQREEALLAPLATLLDEQQVLVATEVLRTVSAGLKGREAPGAE